METKSYLMEQLHNVLHQMNFLVQKILVCENTKYEAIKDMNMDAIINLNDEETFLIQQVDICEKSRDEIVTKMSNLLNCNNDISVSDLVKKLGEDPYKILQVAHILKESCDQLSVITGKNYYILGVNIELIHNILDSTSDSQSQYDQFGALLDQNTLNYKILDQLI